MRWSCRTTTRLAKINSMYDFPQTEKALKKRISSYKASLLKEQRKFGHVNDGAGKRYLLFPMYLVLNNAEEAQDYIAWYENEFSDDVGEPIQKLCWAIILKRIGKEKEARKMLAEAMLANLYLIPKVLGEKIAPYDIWHSSSDAQMHYCEFMPQEVLASLTEAENQWMCHEYESPEFQRIRNRYIEIYRELKNIKNIDARKQLLDESYSLLNAIG
jgi:hypothetical protein